MSGEGGALFFSLAGEILRAGLDGSLYWPAARTLVVADLHLEKASSFARHGRLLPPYDSRATLSRLVHAIESTQPCRVLCLGDSFHDGEAPGRLPPAERAMFATLARGREWIWLHGNHDPSPAAMLGGDSAREVSLGPFLFRHRADGAFGTAAEISGHWHPKATLRIAGRRLGGRCFVAGSRRLILPAFGAYAGGLDARDPAIAGLFPDGLTLLVLGFRRIHKVPFGPLAR